tara:strand:+ start:367 stop:561 length:195 start_codon:yes stop_codon:yes gene_type:complete
MIQKKGSIQENKSLLQEVNVIKAKYKDKYYPCEILEEHNKQSKVLFIDSKYLCYVDNTDITYPH